MTFFSYLISGLSLGAIYAIIALGYTMVYGIAKMLNFAHGDVIMVGGYIAFTCIISLGINPYIATVISAVVCMILGILVEKIAYRPLRGAESLSVLITAIGVSYFLQNIALLIFGANTKSFTSSTFAAGKFSDDIVRVIHVETSFLLNICFLQLSYH